MVAQRLEPRSAIIAAIDHHPSRAERRQAESADQVPGDGDTPDATDLRIKIATEPSEFEQIHRLNHETFAGEIPQHRPDASGRLIDRFHPENTYIIALRGTRLVGMLALRGRRPFSLDAKLPDLDSYLPPGRRVCEIRLLAVARPHRTGRVLRALVQHFWTHAIAQGFVAAVISGTTTQLPLYRRLGFVPFGPVVGTPGAQFQPMLITAERAAPAVQALSATRARRPAGTVNLLPGPVDVGRQVRRAFAARPESHRRPAFRADVEAVRAVLCELTGARRAALLLGSGTLANEAIAAQLSLEPRGGLVLSNGEFGERLVDHAARFQLAFEVVRSPWGAPLDLQAVADRLQAASAPSWIWATHLESSTGILNDVSRLKELGRRTGTKLCLDAVSALGLVPVDVRDVWFASGVSGKGLGSYAGVAIVLHSHEVASTGRLPRYLDLGLYAGGAVPFTHSSNLVHALRSAVEGVDWPERFAWIAEDSAWLRARLRAAGFHLVAAEADAAPGIVSIALPTRISSVEVACHLEREGFALAAHSTYLRERNWLQISLMSRPSRASLAAAVEALGPLVVPVGGLTETPRGA